MPYYLVHVKLDDTLAFPHNQCESEERLRGFLKQTFGDRAYIDNSFGIGHEMSDFHAMAIDIEPEKGQNDEDVQEIRDLVTDWLEQQDSKAVGWFCATENPLYCPNREYDGELNRAVMAHYGALAL